MPSKTLLLTDTIIESLESPCHGVRYVVRDTKVRGLALRVGPDSKTFLVHKKRKAGTSESLKRTIGRYPEKTLQRAREIAKEWIRILESGSDPFVERRQRADDTAAQHAALRRTFGVVFDEYSKAREPNSRPATIKDRNLVRGWLANSPLWNEPLRDISIVHVEETVGPLFRAASPAAVDSDGEWIERPRPPAWGPRRVSLSTAWKVFRFGRAAWAYAANRSELARSNPFATWMAGGNWPKPEKRTRYLPIHRQAGEEWVRHLVKLRDSPNPSIATCADYLTCCLLWAGRRLETMRLRWADINWVENHVTFRRENTKTKKPHFFPLTPWASEILLARKAQNEARGLPVDAEAWVFPSRRRSRAHVKMEVEAKKADLPIPERAMRPTHIKSLKEILSALEQKNSMRLTPHDLRRTVATSLAVSSHSLAVAAGALNHSEGDAKKYEQTLDYIQAKVDLLRDAYERHETRIRSLAVTEPAAAAVSPSHTLAQVAIVKAARTMLQQAGLDPAILVDREGW